MTKAVYFPGFNIRDSLWLKFSLLFYEKLYPIVPLSGDVFISELSKKIQGETDFFEYHRPSQVEGAFASSSTIEFLEKLILNEKDFQIMLNNPNLLESWREIRNHRTTLFKEKYTDSLEAFLKENNLSSSTSKGIKIPDEVSMIFMTKMAQIVAAKKRVLSATDNKTFSLPSIVLNGGTPDNFDAVVTQGILKMTMNSGIFQKGFDEIIILRNNSDFKCAMRAFQEELRKFLLAAENQNCPEEFRKNLDYSWSQVSDLFMRYGGSLVQLFLNATLFFAEAPPGFPEMLKSFLSGIGVLSGTMIMARSIKVDYQQKALVRQYLSYFE